MFLSAFAFINLSTDRFQHMHLSEYHVINLTPMGRSELAMILHSEQTQSLSTPHEPHDIYPAPLICCTPKHSFNISQKLSQGHVCGDLAASLLLVQLSKVENCLLFFCLLIWVAVFCLETIT